MQVTFTVMNVYDREVVDFANLKQAKKYVEEMYEEGWEEELVVLEVINNIVIRDYYFDESWKIGNEYLNKNINEI